MWGATTAEDQSEPLLGEPGATASWFQSEPLPEEPQHHDSKVSLYLRNHSIMIPMWASTWGATTSWCQSVKWASIYTWGDIDLISMTDIFTGHFVFSFHWRADNCVGYTMATFLFHSDSRRPSRNINWVGFQSSGLYISLACLGVFLLLENGRPAIEKNCHSAIVLVLLSKRSLRCMMAMRELFHILTSRTPLIHTRRPQFSLHPNIYTHRG